ncbi:hypothetical protein D9M71_795820 [compost metagenome]
MRCDATALVRVRAVALQPSKARLRSSFRASSPERLCAKSPETLLAVRERLVLLSSDIAIGTP